jgi:hypothetical protein
LAVSDDLSLEVKGMEEGEAGRDGNQFDHTCGAPVCCTEGWGGEDDREETVVQQCVLGGDQKEAARARMGARAVKGGVWGGSKEKAPGRVGVDGPAGGVAEDGAKVLVPRGRRGGEERAWGVADMIHYGAFGRMFVEVDYQTASKAAVRGSEVVEVGW